MVLALNFSPFSSFSYSLIEDINLFVRSLVIQLPPISNSRFIFLTYQFWFGANFSPKMLILLTKSLRLPASIGASFKQFKSLSTIASTFYLFVILNSKSSVFTFNVSSVSSRQSTTRVQQFNVYLGSILTIEARPVIPMYFKLYDSDERNLEIVQDARSING